MKNDGIDRNSRAGGTILLWGGAARAERQRRMTQALHFLLLLLALSLLGCASHLDDRKTWLTVPQQHAPIEPAKDGEILVFVYGDARLKGPHWISEDANILAVEEISGAGDEGVITLEPKFAVICREVNGRILELRYDLRRRTRLEKQDIHLKHGDKIMFPWSNCW
jgi:hypothetical protein